jgi:hypothetical protein
MRGHQEIYTYLGTGEDLLYSFTIQDINRHADADAVNVTVYDPDGTKIKEVKEPDDGVQAASGRVLPERQITVQAAGTQPGVYRLVIDATDDIFIKKIVTSQHLLMFMGHVYLTDNQEYRAILGNAFFAPAVLYTNSSVIRVSTSHVKSLQTVAVGSENLVLDAVSAPVEKTGLYGITAIESPVNDVYIEGNGFFAFSQSQLFDLTRTLVPSLDSVNDVDDYNYVIASYRPATKEGDWLVAFATVTAPQLFFDKGNDLLSHFIINMPGLHENGKVLQVKEVSVQFQKDPITIGKIAGKLTSWFKK